MLYTIEDEPRMMAIHEEAIRKEAEEKTREEDMEKMILAFIDTGYSPNEALKLTEKTYNELPEHLIEKLKEKTNALYSVEDESRMMATHEEAIRKEIREKDIKVMIQAFVDAGFSSEEATRRIEEAFKKLP